MDYKTEGDEHLKEGRYLEYYNSYKKYNNNTQTEESSKELDRAKKKYDLYLELIDFLKKDENKYYEILNLKKDATQKEIRDSYTKLMSKYHPDKTKIKESNSVSRILHKAYVILSNEKKRKEYDEGSKFRSKEWNFNNMNYHNNMNYNMNYQDVNFYHNNMNYNMNYHDNVFDSYIYRGDEYTILNNILYRHFYRYTPNRRLERIRWNDQMFAKIVVLILLSYFILFV